MDEQIRLECLTLARQPDGRIDLDAAQQNYDFVRGISSESPKKPAAKKVRK